MKKIAFVVDGVVNSIAAVYSDLVTVSSTVPGAVSINLPDGSPAAEGWLVDTSGPEPVFTAPAPAAPVPPKVSPLEYKLLFTSAERIAIAAAKATDPVLQDLYSILDDPRLTFVDLGLQSTSDALDYLTGINLIAAGRKAEILTGVIK
jgi:hypothetical protein